MPRRCFDRLSRPLRGSDPADHALRRDQVARAAERDDASSCPPDPKPPVHAAVERDAAHLAEFGIAAPIGSNGIEQLLDVIADPTDERVPADARFYLEMLAAQLRIIKEQILENDKGADPRERSSHPGERTRDRTWPSPDGNTWCWSAARQCDCRDRSRSSDLWLWPQPSCLDRLGTMTELEWRQGAARRYHQGRAPISTSDADRRCNGSGPLCRTEWRQTPLARAAACPPQA